MDITFSAASTAGLNNPGTEIITLVKDGSGNFINPPSYDKIRAYLRSGEVPMLFVTTEGGETGSFYQFVEYSETENKIRFGNDTNTIEFSAGADTPVVSDVGGGGVWPDWNQNDSTAADYVKNRPFYTGNPAETVLVEERTELFADEGGIYSAEFQSTFIPTVGEIYKVSWDGTVYECTSVGDESQCNIGNLSIIDSGSDTGEPFVLYTEYTGSISIYTADTSASHTFSISGNAAEIVKIPAKYIDKNSSGYIILHKNDTMTEQEAENYRAAIVRGEAVYLMWKSGTNGRCFKYIQFDEMDNQLLLITQNGETYYILKNAAGLFALSDMKLQSALFPSSFASEDRITKIKANREKIVIYSSFNFSGVGSTDVLFEVAPNGEKSKAFDVLGTGEAVTPALILYSSSANSTKKFKITVDDTGAISATEVT